PSWELPLTPRPPLPQGERGSLIWVVGKVGGHPQTPGREIPAPLCWGREPPSPQQGNLCTPFSEREGWEHPHSHGRETPAPLRLGSIRTPHAPGQSSPCLPPDH